MSEYSPPLRINDRVYVIGPPSEDGPRRYGHIADIYPNHGRRRCMVAFDDGTEGTFFEFELEPELT